MFSCEFCKISRNNFFIVHIQGTAFGLSFVKVCEGTSLVKLLQSCHFNKKWKKDLLERKGATTGGIPLKRVSQKFHNIQVPVTESLFK